jgi:hypothetical protein
MKPSPHTPKANMTSSVAERRLAVARRLSSVLVAERPDQAITLRDGQGQVVASTEPDQDSSGTPRPTRKSAISRRRIGYALPLLYFTK